MFDQNILKNPNAAINAAGAANATPKLTSSQIIYGYDANTGQEIERLHQAFDDGTTTTTDFINGVPQVAIANPFNTASKNLSNSVKQMFATNVDAADADYGLIYALNEIQLFEDGMLDPTATTYWDTNVFPNANVTALVTAAPFSLDVMPERVKYTPELLAVTGAVPAQLAAAPALAGHVRIYIEDENIRWTSDGSAPSDNNGMQSAAGTYIDAERDEIANLRFLPADAQGNVDATLTANLTANYANVALDED